MGSAPSKPCNMEQLSVRDVANAVYALFPYNDYSHLVKKYRIDGGKLKILSSAGQDALRDALAGCGVSDSVHATKLASAFSSACSYYRRSECEHSYLEKLDDKYYCMDCKCQVTALERIVQEQEWELRLDAAVSNDHIGIPQEKESQLRGVRIGWLVQWTNENNCWDLPTWKVRRDFIIPATAATRCRYTELPCMQEGNGEHSNVGPAVTYVSHSWGGRYGDLVAAISDCADPNRYVWIDLFAVRQWSSPTPDDRYVETISLCKSFMLVCSCPQELERWQLRGTGTVAASVTASTTGGAADTASAGCGVSTILLDKMKNQMSLFRIWCLAELKAAADCRDHSGDMAICIRVGSYYRQGEEPLVPSTEALAKLQALVDVRIASATSKTDKRKLLAKMEGHGCGDGESGVNDTIRKMLQCSSLRQGHPAVFCAACGDESAYMQLLLRPTEALLDAACAGYCHLIQLLLREGVDVDVRSSDLMTPLMLATSGGHVACVKCIIQAGADCNATDAMKRTALVWAAQGGHLECLELLVCAGTIPDLRTSHDRTALLQAVEGGHVQCAQSLIVYGADPTAKDCNGWTSLHLAAEGGHTPCLAMFLKEDVKIDHAGKDGSTALMLAAGRGFVDCVDFLLQKGANPNLKTTAGMTALAYAAQSGFMDCMHILLLHGANIRATDAGGRTVAMYAAKGGHTLCVKALVLRGVHINAIDKNNWTAWKYAYVNNHRDCVRALEELGAEETHAFKCTVK